MSGDILTVKTVKRVRSVRGSALVHITQAIENLCFAIVIVSINRLFYTHLLFVLKQHLSNLNEDFCKRNVTEQ